MKTHAAQIFRARLVVGLLTVLSLTLMSTGRATAQGVIRINVCPFVIAAPGQYLVTQDLFCPPGFFGILVESNDVKLNLGGHTITGTALNGGGVWVRGTFFSPFTNVEVRNGTITNFSRGIVLDFANEGRIEAITLTANSLGLQIENAHDNTITSSEFSNNVSHGVQQQGSNGNVFRGNKATGNLQAGYLLFGNNNLITSTTASASIITGNQTHGVIIGLGSNGNTVQGSQVLGNVNFGIALAQGANNTTVSSNTVNENGRGITVTLGATVNTIVSNTAQNNIVFDLEDDNPNCDANVWRHNNFNTTNQPQCID
jgi:parallel beta-helix repeat protein